MFSVTGSVNVPVVDTTVWSGPPMIAISSGQCARHSGTKSNEQQCRYSNLVYNEIDIADRLTEINMVRDMVIISLKIPIIVPMIYSINMIYSLLNDEPVSPGRFTLSA